MLETSFHTVIMRKSSFRRKPAEPIIEDKEEEMDTGQDDDGQKPKMMPDGSMVGYGIKITRVPNPFFPTPPLRTGKFKVPTFINKGNVNNNNNKSNVTTTTPSSTTTTTFKNKSSTNDIKPVIKSNLSTKMNNNSNKTAVKQESPVKHSPPPPSTQSSQSQSNVVVWACLYSKASTRKNKKWENDGYLYITNGKELTLMDSAGRVVQKNSNYELPAEVESGTILPFGGKEIQLDEICPSPPFEKDKASQDPRDPGSTSSCDSDSNKVPTFINKGNVNNNNNKSNVTTTTPSSTTTTTFKNKSSTNDIKPVIKSNLSTKMNNNSNKTAVKQESPVKHSPPPPSTQSSQSQSNVVVWACLYSKASTRKNKKWENDGYLYITNGKELTLMDSAGRFVQKNSNYELPAEVESGTILPVGGKEIQLDEICPSPPFEKDKASQDLSNSSCDSDNNKINQIPVKLPTKLISKPFKNPCNPEIHKKVNRGNPNLSKPLYDPNAPGAFVLPEPEWDHKGLPIVPVVVDPHISKHLRPHQREGVEFLYKAVYLDALNAKSDKPGGSILADDKKSDKPGGCMLCDDMGLGKTLQCITLLWTMYRQGPYQRIPLAKRILIITPSSLVKNWEKEFNRWLGVERIRVWAVDSKHTVDMSSIISPVIIISYDMAVRSAKSLKTKKFDLMICDEAHKIKNPKNQAYQLIKSLNCSRRILLSGTPVQNDLMELFALVELVRPGALGTENEFKKEYLKPIQRIEDDSSSTTQKGIGMRQAALLNSEMSSFFLRRDSTVMLQYLPDRVTQIVFCRPSRLQAKLYKAVMNSEIVMDCLTGSCQTPLAVITLLKKLCNHPYLVHPKNQDGDSEIYEHLGPLFPTNISHQRFVEEDSGKLLVLIQMLKMFQKQGKKVVLVSHSTKTLDVLGDICSGRGLSIVRLDGSTQQQERMSIVDKFNDSKEPLIFLLSSKAGGVGLNLQSSQKIILYDIDWNPAHDVQAMARCWRPGQKKETHIYRLLTCGTMEERIYQRQISKQDISGSVIDLLLSNTTKFSPDVLKDIFTFYEDATCLTHELMGCECNGDGLNVKELQENEMKNDENQPPKKKRKIEGMGELLNWEHFRQPFDGHELDPALIHPSVEFIFRNRSSVSNEEDDELFEQDSDVEELFEQDDEQELFEQDDEQELFEQSDEDEGFKQDEEEEESTEVHDQSDKEDTDDDDFQM